MPIEFPRVKRGNVFDRWIWVRGAPSFFPGASMSTSQPAPNIARPGFPFDEGTLDPGYWRPASLSPNLRRLGRMYQNGPASRATVNPAPLDKPDRVYGGAGSIDAASRQTGTLNMNLTGVTRDKDGVALGNCLVLFFREADKAFISSITSDSSGNFSATLNLTGPFFTRAYKVGSPDLAGTSLNTLLPSPA